DKTVPGANRVTPETAGVRVSEGDEQLVIDLHELDDHVRELTSDQLLIGRRAGVRVVRGLIGEVLDEQEVVDVRWIAIHPEGQCALLACGALGGEFLHDRFGLGLHAVLEFYWEYLCEHGFSL